MTVYSADIEAPRNLTGPSEPLGTWRDSIRLIGQARPHKGPGLAPQEAGLAPQEAGLAPQEVGFATQEVGFAPQEAGLVPQEVTLGLR